MDTRDRFILMMTADNSYAVTLKFKPQYWALPKLTREILQSYLNHSSRQIEYYLYDEHEDTNFHMHGLLAFNHHKQYTNFRRWFNKNMGTIHVSEKEDCNGWYNYCTKDAFKDVYLF